MNDEVNAAWTSLWLDVLSYEHNQEAMQLTHRFLTTEGYQYATLGLSLYQRYESLLHMTCEGYPALSTYLHMTRNDDSEQVSISTSMAPSRFRTQINENTDNDLALKRVHCVVWIMLMMRNTMRPAVAQHRNSVSGNSNCARFMEAGSHPSFRMATYMRLRFFNIQVNNIAQCMALDVRLQGSTEPDVFQLEIFEGSLDGNAAFPCVWEAEPLSEHSSDQPQQQRGDTHEQPGQSSGERSFAQVMNELD